MSSALMSALAGLKAQHIRMDVSANNVANVETEGFKRSRVLTQEARSAGLIVTIERDDRPGVIVPAHTPEGDRRERSNVNVHEELAGLIVTRYTYEAGVVSLRVAEELEQSLMNILC